MSVQAAFSPFGLKSHQYHDPKLLPREMATRKTLLPPVWRYWRIQGRGVALGGGPIRRLGRLAASQQPEEVGANRARSLRSAQRQEHDDRQQEQPPEQEQRRPDPTLAGEEDREQNDRAEVGDRPGGDDELAEGRGDLPRVLEHRHDHPERGRAQDDRHQQRRLDEPRGLEPEPDDDRDREGEHEAAEGELQDLATRSRPPNEGMLLSLSYAASVRNVVWVGGRRIRESDGPS